jgi:hypothetical protein
LRERERDERKENSSEVLAKEKSGQRQNPKIIQGVKIFERRATICRGQVVRGKTV